MATRKAAADKVTLVPTGTAFIPGVPAIEQTVSAKRAAELLAWSPPAFKVKRGSKAEPINEATDSAPAAPAEEI